MRYATDNHRVPGPALPRLCALLLLAALAAWSLGPAAQAARAGDLDDIRASGELRHLGIPYAGFITGSGDGLDVELMRRFAEHLGVRYRFVDTDWAHIFSDLTGETYDLS
ncbi:MAG: transporter substrate-binding domain-containing protein, partial [Desulfovibrionaceae bacterium]